MPDRTWTRRDWRLLHRRYRVEWGKAWEVGLLTYPGPIRQRTGIWRSFAAWCLDQAADARRRRTPDGLTAARKLIGLAATAETDLGA